MTDRLTPEPEAEFGSRDWLEALSVEERLRVATTFAKFTDQSDPSPHAFHVSLTHLTWALAELVAVRAERDELAKRVTRAIFALKSPPPPGSQHYRSGWDDGLDAAIDAARAAIEEAAR